MKWQYKAAFFILILSQTIFFIFAAYHTEIQINNQNQQTEYSWIWYHLEHWIISLVLALISLFLFLYGILYEILDSKRKQLKETKKDPKPKRKWWYIILLFVVWVVIIFFSLYFYGFFNFA